MLISSTAFAKRKTREKPEMKQKPEMKLKSRGPPVTRLYPTAGVNGVRSQRDQHTRSPCHSLCIFFGKIFHLRRGVDSWLQY